MLKPVIASTAAAFAPVTDINNVADFAQAVGNRRVGTSAQRAAVLGTAQVYEGLEWFDTTLKYTFVYLGSDWAPRGLAGVVAALAGFTVGSDTSLTLVSGMVRLYVRASGTFASNTNYAVCTLPVGFRPLAVKYAALLFSGSSFPAAGGLEILANGTVNFFNGPGAHTTAGGYVEFAVGA